MKKSAFAAALAAALSLGAAQQSEMNVDVLVVGGTTKGVEAAKAAHATGKSVYLVTPYAALGEDLASTLELGFDAGRKPQTALEKRLWQSIGGLAQFSYKPSRPTDGIRWIYHNDAKARLAEPNDPPTMDDCVLFIDDVTYTCVLRKPAKISKVGVLVMEADTFKSSAIISKADWARLEKTKPGVRKVATQAVEIKVKAGPRKGETVALARRGAYGEIPRGLAYPHGRAILFEGEVGADLSEVEITLKADPAAHHQLISRIWFHLAEADSVLAPPSPLKVKRTYDKELMENGVGFITSSPVRRVLRGTDGRPSGVEIVNRSGRRIIRAKEIVDATLYGTFGKVPAVGAEETFSRIVIGNGCKPSAPGMTVESLPGDFRDPQENFAGEMVRCTFKLPMKDGTFPSFAAAEWEARELTQVSSTADAADVLTWHPSPKALAEAKDLPDEPPVWGEYDVVVVGGGTAGAPAGLAAARSGAKTLIVEYRDMLGGVGSDGMVTGYFDGNKVGFVAEYNKFHYGQTGKNIGQYGRGEAWRRLCREAGATVWFGAMGLEAIREGGKVVGVEVATPLGTGVVKAKCVIDGTGNSDVAAGAGAETELVSAREIAIQSAGQAPQRLGFGGINSDFGYLNDGDAWDLWLFCLRARAGAPDAWDIAKLPDSRERRRIVPDYRLRGEDVSACRRYPDTVAQALSRQDPHGYLTDDFGYLSQASTELVEGAKENRAMFRVNLPLRCMLPKGLSGLAVVGLGAGIERDVVTITRMQADLMNMGYGVGVAAAMAAKNGGDFRTIDLKALRAALVAKGNLPDEAKDWDAEDDVSSDALIAESVRTLPDGFKGGHVLYRPENRARAIPLLRAAYAATHDAKAQQAYALALGLMGDAAGIDTLVACLTGKKHILNVRSGGGAGVGGKFARAYSAGGARHGMLLALARTKDKRAVEPLLLHLRKLTPQTPFGEVRVQMVAMEAFGGPELAEALAQLLKADGLHGYAVKDVKDLKPIGGYGIGPEFEHCFMELAVARALLACGDFEGLGRRTYESYAQDPRGLLSAHAKAVLAQLRP